MHKFFFLLTTKIPDFVYKNNLCEKSTKHLIPTLTDQSWENDSLALATKHTKHNQYNWLDKINNLIAQRCVKKQGCDSSSVWTKEKSINDSCSILVEKRAVNEPPLSAKPNSVVCLNCLQTLGSRRE